MIEIKSQKVKKNNLLIVLYYYHPYVSGVSICAKRVAEGMVRAGYNVTVLTSHFDNDLPNEEIINGVKIIRRPVALQIGKGVLMPTFWLDIIKYARKNDYVNPHLPMAESGISSIFIPRRKIITTYQCDIFLGKGIVNRLIAYISSCLMKLQLHRSNVVVPSTIDYLSNSKMKKYIFKAVPIYPSVTISDFKPIKSDKLFNKLMIEKDIIKIGFVGRVVYEKGINYLLESIPYLTNNFKNFKIIIVGDYHKVAGGSIKKELDEYLIKYPSRIIFTGYLSDLERNQFYSGIDVLVLPSIDPLEAYGMVQVEAMLCGSPVVASNLPGVREIVKITGFGKISQLKDPEDIAEQIIEVVTHRQKYAPIRSKLISLFDPKDAINMYSQLMPK